MCGGECSTESFTRIHWRCRDARVCGHPTTAMHEIEYMPPIEYTPPPLPPSLATFTTQRVAVFGLHSVNQPMLSQPILNIFPFSLPFVRLTVCFPRLSACVSLSSLPSSVCPGLSLPACLYALPVCLSCLSRLSVCLSVPLSLVHLLLCFWAFLFVRVIFVLVRARILKHDR